MLKQDHECRKNGTLKAGRWVHCFSLQVVAQIGLVVFEKNAKKNALFIPKK